MACVNPPADLLKLSSSCVQYYLDNDAKLKKFVPIIHDSVVYPVILDANRTICSMPPIINGAHSAVGLTTGCTEHVATQIVQWRLELLL